MADDTENNEAPKSKVIPGETAAEGAVEQAGAGENAAAGSQKNDGQKAIQATAASQAKEAITEVVVSELPYVGQTIEGKGVVYAVKRVLGDTFIKISNDAADWQQI